MNSREYKLYCRQAYESLLQLNEQLKQDFKLEIWKRWDYDLEASTLTFSNDDIPRVIATIQAAGTTSSKSGTWMWGWANGTLPSCVTDQLFRIKQFGEGENISQLAKDKFPADEELAWQLAAVATRILGGKGVYRCPSGNGLLFLVVMDICFYETDRNSEARKAEKRAEVECSTHTTGFETFLCEHLANNPAQVWFSEEPSDSNPWPDSWCSKCHEAFKEQGQWNDQNEGRMRVRLLCHRCYERARTKAASMNSV